MIEKTILDFLSADFNAYMEVPQDPPDTYIIIDKTGSSLDSKIRCTATFAIQSYAPTLYQAASLNDRVKNKMLDLLNLKEIVSVTLVSDYNYTDTTKKAYRYQAIFSLVHYKE